MITLVDDGFKLSFKTKEKMFKYLLEQNKGIDNYRTDIKFYYSGTFPNIEMPKERIKRTKEKTEKIEDFSFNPKRGYRVIKLRRLRKKFT